MATSNAIRDLQFASGDPGAILAKGAAQSQQVASNTPVQNFNNQLMDLLKSYQTMGTAPFIQQQFNAQNAQTDASNTALTDPSLRGYAPSTIMNAGQSAAAPYNPTIAGAKQGAQTFGEQLTGFGNAVDRVQGLVQQYEQQQNQARDDARATLHDITASYDPASVSKLYQNDPAGMAQLEKLAGFPKNYALDAVTYKQKQLDAANAKLNQKGTGTGTSTGDSTTYSTIDISRYSRAANAIVKNFIGLPQYNLTANGLPYLQRIQAADSIPGSVSDAELLDSIVKLNTGGNQVTEAQVALITGGRSLADALNVWKNKLGNGGVLSDTQRQQLTALANKVFERYKQDYQPIYVQATKQLKDAGIPEAFWTIPNLNDLSSQESGGGNNAPNFSSVSGQSIYQPPPGGSSGSLDYQAYLKSIGQ